MSDRISKQWKVIAVCGLAGFLVAAFFFIFVGILGVVDGDMLTGMLVLCPPSLLCIPLSEAMKLRGGFYAISLLIGFLNSGLYATIGAALVGLLSKSDT